jgi:hypothetical protein
VREGDGTARKRKNSMAPNLLLQYDTSMEFCCSTYKTGTTVCRHVDRGRNDEKELEVA